MIESASYLPDGSILVIDQGVSKFVPDDMGNSDRRALDEWVAAGGEIAPSSVDLLAYAAQKRWEKETGGIVVSGVPIATDDRAKIMLSGARQAAEANAEFVTPWVGADGQIYELTALQIIDVGNAVLAHVSACFATYATVATLVAAGTITTTAEVDVQFA